MLKTRSSRAVLLWVLLCLVAVGVPAAAAAGADDAAGRQIVSLRDAVAEALRHSPQMKAAGARLQEAEARAVAVVAEVRGRVDGEATGGAFSAPSRMDGMPASVRTQGTQATGAVTWTGHLWLSPEGRAALAAAQANVAAARKEWQDAMAQVVQGVTQAYLDLLRAQGGAAVAAQRREWAEEAWRITQERYKRGQATEVELLEAEAERAAARADEEDARRGRTLAANQLLLWMGRPLDGSAVAVDPLATQDPVIEQVVEDLRSVVAVQGGQIQVDRDAVLAKALERRLDVQAARAQKAAAEAGAAATEAGSKADFGISAEYEWRYAGLSAAVNRWGQGQVRAEGGTRWMRKPIKQRGGLREDDAWTVGIYVRWPLGDGGAQGAKEREAQARIAMVDAQLEHLVPGIELELDAALHDVHRTMWTLDVAKARLEAAERNLDQVRRLQELDAATELDVLGARTRVAAAALEYDVARWLQIGADIRLAVATGWIPQGIGLDFADDEESGEQADAGVDELEAESAP